jgi:acylglycerol lipase
MRIGGWVKWSGSSRGLTRTVAAIAAIVPLVACVPTRPQLPVSATGTTRLAAEAVVTADGSRLPLRHWGEARAARGIVLALHGFNDYSAAFAQLGPYLAERRFVVYAYDQRGFGAAPGRGRWAGEDRLIEDAHAVAVLLKQRHPNLPLHLLGESMGGSEVMLAADRVGASGVVLIAPAVWSRDKMNPVQRWILEVAANAVPWMELTGEGLDRPPSDNLPMLRAYARDPLVLKGARVESLWGLVNLMDRARGVAPEQRVPTLLLYGANDKIVPKEAFCATLADYPEPAPDLKVVLYTSGWHMLTRDLQGRRVLRDISGWLSDASAPIPSGEQTERGSERLKRLCGPGA